MRAMLSGVFVVVVDVAMAMPTPMVVRMPQDQRAHHEDEHTPHEARAVFERQT